MGQKSREKKNRKGTARAKFRPETIGYIEGLRLAAWMADKSPGMMDMYRRENGIAGPVRDVGPPVAWNDKKRLVRKIVDPSPENSRRVPIPVQTQEPPCGTSAVLTTTCATTEAPA